MDTNPSKSAIENDVLHFENHSKLTAEQIAKAVAHHNKHHSGEQKMEAPSKSGGGKKTSMK
jgi:hypothetical protein